MEPIHAFQRRGGVMSHLEKADKAVINWLAPTSTSGAENRVDSESPNQVWCSPHCPALIPACFR